jgi:tRNA nucleotidyltransferase (CCA-adding enzyme)
MIELDSSTLRELVEADPATARVLDALDGHLDGVHLVGGAVRDLLLGRTPSETDLVVEGDAGRVAARLAKSLSGQIEAHGRFGTATVTSDGLTVDVAMARTEAYPAPGSLPEVSPATILEDLRRRDFTVNAIAVALEPGARGTWVAADSAVDDLNDRVLRVLHAGSFEDDPTRLWRLTRYAGRLGFDAEPGTASAALRAVEGGALQTVSPGRHGSELVRNAAAAEPAASLEAADGLGLLAAIGAEGYDSTAVVLAAGLLGDECDLQGLRVASCFSRAGVDGEAAVRRLALPHKLTSCALEALAVRELSSAVRIAERPSDLARLLGGRTPEVVALAGATGSEVAVRNWFEEIRHIECPIGGDELIAAGVEQGPLVAVGLEAAMSARLDHGETDPERSLATALAAVAAEAEQ